MVTDQAVLDRLIEYSTRYDMSPDQLATQYLALMSQKSAASALTPEAISKLNCDRPKIRKNLVNFSLFHFFLPFSIP